MSATGYVYVVKSSNGLLKIGHTNEPSRRLTMLRTSTADQLTLLGVVPATVEQEKELHGLLHEHRVAREWFRPCPAMQPLLDGLRPHCQPRAKSYKTQIGPMSTAVEVALRKDGRPFRQISLLAGLGPNYAWDISRGRKSPTIRCLTKLATALNVPVETLIGNAA